MITLISLCTVLWLSSPELAGVILALTFFRCWSVEGMDWYDFFLPIYEVSDNLLTRGVWAPVSSSSNFLRGLCWSVVNLSSFLRWNPDGLRYGLLWLGEPPSSTTLSIQLVCYFLLEGESALGVSTDGMVTVLALLLSSCLVDLLLLMPLVCFFIGDK